MRMLPPEEIDMPLLLGYAAALSAFCFLLMGLDKKKAQKGRRRVPERLLLYLAILGGSIGIYAGMWVFRHKTRHMSFTLGLPILIILQAILFYCFFFL